MEALGAEAFGGSLSTGSHSSRRGVFACLVRISFRHLKPTAVFRRDVFENSQSEPLSLKVYIPLHYSVHNHAKAMP